MFWITGAFRAMGKEMTFLEDAIYALRVRDALREGMRAPDDIAGRALEMEGWRAKWITCGQICRLEVEPLAP